LISGSSARIVGMDDNLPLAFCEVDWMMQSTLLSGDGTPFAARSTLETFLDLHLEHCDLFGFSDRGFQV